MLGASLGVDTQSDDAQWISGVLCKRYEGFGEEAGQFLASPGRSAQLPFAIFIVDTHYRQFLVYGTRISILEEFL